MDIEAALRMVKWIKITFVSRGRNWDGLVWPRGGLSEQASMCMQAGVPEMDARERTVAIRSLLVSTARESPEVAVVKAVEDVRRFRRDPLLL